MAEKEYIERKKLLDTLNEEKIPYNSDINYIITTIPAADVRENIKSEWGPDHATALCRNCGSLFPAFLRMENFCPNCGAEMKGVKNGL